MPFSVQGRIRIALITAAAAVMSMLVPAVAQAEPPSNDDFDAATVISALPFTTQVDTSEATTASDDPQWCRGFGNAGTVWFDYTATDNVLLRATTAGSSYSTELSVDTGERGHLQLAASGCGNDSGSGATQTFPVTAGTTYHFMITPIGFTGGMLSFALDIQPPAANDNFADAEIVSALPSDPRVDMTTASTETGEPTPSCASLSNHSVWYAFTPARPVTVAAHAQGDSGDFSVAVYTGTGLADLREVGCGRPFDAPVVFPATAGVTYYFQVVGEPDFRNFVTLHLTEAPPPQPVFFVDPSDPTIYQETVFEAESGDPVGQPIASGQWTFGDGTSEPLEDIRAGHHHYTVDGTYQVGLSITMRDGRTGSTIQPVVVKTHDVSAAKFDVPDRARTGQTKLITLSVANTRYLESVTVDVFRDNGHGFDEFGTLTLDVPARANRTVQFPFAYTFTAADALIGKVTFRAVVRLPFGVRDARPQDNELIAFSTTVLPSITDLRFA
jgi:hypothetical protein